MGQSTIRSNHELVHETDDATTVIGSVRSPIEVDGANTTQGRCAKKMVRLEAFGDADGADRVLVWDGTLPGAIRDFSALVLRILTAGAEVQCLWMVDTADVDGAPTGTYPKVIPDSEERGGLREWRATRLWMNATNNTTMGLTADEPSLFTASGNAWFYRYKLWLWNKGTAAVDAEFAEMH